MIISDKTIMKMNKDRKWQYLSGMGWKKKFSIGNKTELVQVLQRNELIEQVNLLIIRI